MKETKIVIDGKVQKVAHDFDKMAKDRWKDLARNGKIVRHWRTTSNQWIKTRQSGNWTVACSRRDYTEIKAMKRIAPKVSGIETSERWKWFHENCIQEEEEIVAGGKTSFWTRAERLARKNEGNKRRAARQAAKKARLERAAKRAERTLAMAEEKQARAKRTAAFARVLREKKARHERTVARKQLRKERNVATIATEREYVRRPAAREGKIVFIVGGSDSEKVERAREVALECHKERLVACGYVGELTTTNGKKIAVSKPVQPTKKLVTATPTASVPATTRPPVRVTKPTVNAPPKTSVPAQKAACPTGSVPAMAKAPSPPIAQTASTSQGLGDVDDSPVESVDDRIRKFLLYFGDDPEDPAFDHLLRPELASEAVVKIPHMMGIECDMIDEGARAEDEYLASEEGQLSIIDTIRQFGPLEEHSSLRKFVSKDIADGKIDKPRSGGTEKMTTRKDMVVTSESATGRNTDLKMPSEIERFEFDEDVVLDSRDWEWMSKLYQLSEKEYINWHALYSKLDVDAKYHLGIKACILDEDGFLTFKEWASRINHVDYSCFHLNRIPGLVLEKEPIKDLMSPLHEDSEGDARSVCSAGTEESSNTLPPVPKIDDSSESIKDYVSTGSVRGGRSEVGSRNSKNSDGHAGDPAVVSMLKMNAQKWRGALPVAKIEGSKLPSVQWKHGKGGIDIDVDAGWLASRTTLHLHTIASGCRGYAFTYHSVTYSQGHVTHKRDLVFPVVKGMDWNTPEYVENKCWRLKCSASESHEDGDVVIYKHRPEQVVENFPRPKAVKVGEAEDPNFNWLTLAKTTCPSSVNIPS
ncbi:hypothetical protein M8J77_003096 [Diaphorina citri]|nr:hypothetical protein M8J77_003096 [Diaphorina citri]